MKVENRFKVGTSVNLETGVIDPPDGIETVISGVHLAAAFEIPIDVHYHRVEHDGEYSKAYDNPSDIVDTVGCRIVKHVTIELPLDVVSEEPNNG